MATLDDIRRDTDHGAAQLARWGVDLLGQCADLDEAVGVARQLGSLRPSMAPIAYWAARFMGEAFHQPTLSTERATKIAGELIDEMDRMSVDLVESARPLLGSAKRIATLSWSTTVIALIVGVVPRTTPILVAESRPLNEGRMTADRLLTAMFNVTLVTDAVFPGLLQEGDILLIGADTILPDGGVINKSGSYPAALAAREVGVPVWVGADTTKLAPVGRPVGHETGDAAHVWLDRPGVCENLPFETAPSGLITGYLTERGAVDRSFIQKEADRTARLLALLDG